MFQSGSYYNEFFCTTGYTCEVLSQCANVDECQVYVRRQGLLGAYFSYAEACADPSTCVYHVCSAATQTGCRVPLDANLEDTRHCLHQHWFIRIAVIVLSILFLLVLCCCLAYCFCCRRTVRSRRVLRSTSCVEEPPAYVQRREVVQPRVPRSAYAPRYEYRKYEPAPRPPPPPPPPPPAPRTPRVYRTWQVTRDSAAPALPLELPVQRPDLFE